MTHQSFKFTRKNVIFLLFCLGGILLLLLISLVPLQKEHDQFARQLPELKKQIAEQQQLLDILTMLDKKITQLPESDFPKIHLSPLPFDKTGLLLTDLRQASKNNNMKLLTVYPQLQDKNADWQQLTVHSKLQGHFNDFRQFLFDFLALPYIKEINKIEINAGDGILNFNLTFTVMLS